MFTVQFARKRNLERLASETFDVVVLGDGIQASVLALDAASRGLSTAVIAPGDIGETAFSAAPVLLTHEASTAIDRRAAKHELDIIADNWTSLTEPTALMSRGSHQRRPRVVDALTRSPSRRHLDASMVAAHAPHLEGGRMGDPMLTDAILVDEARLALSLTAVAADRYGAVAVNHCGDIEMLTDEGRAVGLRIDPTETSAASPSDALDVSSRVIVDARAVTQTASQPAGGVHRRLNLVVPRHLFDTDVAIHLDADGSRLRLLPVDAHLVVSADRPPGPSHEVVTADAIIEVLSLLAEFTAARIQPVDVTAVWFGRTEPPVHARKPSSRVREAEDGRLVIDPCPPILDARTIADAAIDLVVTQLGFTTSMRPCRTARLELDEPNTARVVQAIIAGDPRLALPIIDGLPYVRAEVVHAVRYAMASTLTDVLARRTRALGLDIVCASAAAHDVAALMAAELGWTNDVAEQHATRFVADAAIDLAPVTAASSARI